MHNTPHVYGSIVIGAGPIGLAAAAHLLERGVDTLVLEAGDLVGSTVRDWTHVRMFSTWASVVDPASRRRLEAAGWTKPEPAGFPTGGDLVETYLEPLADTLGDIVQLSHRVVAIAKANVDKVVTAGRADSPFLVRAETPTGMQEFLAVSVIDASGTWMNPNPLGTSGLPVPGETESTHIRYGMPDVLGRERSRYAGRRTMVVGAGHSAANVLLDLVELAGQVPGTEPIWAIRRPDPSRTLGGLEDDELVERGKIGLELGHRIDDGRLELLTGFRITNIEEAASGIVVTAAPDQSLTVDEVIVATGQRPDLDITRELRLDLDPWLEAPRSLAPLIDPNVHSCATVPPHGADQLSHPEPGFYTVGIKSYGRAPTFLLATGYEQVRSVVAAIAGDWEQARTLEFTPAGTGACGVPGDKATSACC